MKSYRQTKIVATLGPATDKPEVMEAMIRAGVDVVRVNFSHGDREEHAERIELVREISRKLNKSIGVLADLQGPKIRIARFIDKQIELRAGDEFQLNVDLDDNTGTETAVGVTYKELARDVKMDDILMLDDGNIILKVIDVFDPIITTEVVFGGILSDSKGINRQGGGLTAESLTSKDHQDIRTAGSMDVDYLAVSFVRNAVDVNVARELLRAANCNGGIISKIERVEAVERVDEIVEASDGIMIARGDLAVEIGDAQLPGVQKRLIGIARDRNRLVITATQMMQSMIENTQPTRAEVLDVANAVLDGTDAVMLSQESAVGRHPPIVVAAVDRICRGSEQTEISVKARDRKSEQYQNAEEAVAMATMFTASNFDITAILALTESGATAKWLSRTISGIPIFAVTPHSHTLRRVRLFRGVEPISYDVDAKSNVPVVEQVLNEFLQRGILSKGDRLIVTMGAMVGVAGGTDTMRIITA